ncbi:hypothetical protein PIB30_088371 [Stylosanthes scabra]|uniref:Uncharacterized protein n=1 Tax=Stylosanthes scabra TaxID=79078 RepID=A0ABU6RV05_9FABA|nr:hypothetical protein [Stylosanthes scabra]
MRLWLSTLLQEIAFLPTPLAVGKYPKPNNSLEGTYLHQAEAGLSHLRVLAKAVLVVEAAVEEAIKHGIESTEVDEPLYMCCMKEYI